MINGMTFWVEEGELYVSDAELYLVSEELLYLDICHERQTVPIILETKGGDTK